MRFFSRLRQSLTRTKGLQYLKYAIGEIILVVIGILIAVWINNTNEDRKTKNARVDLAKKVAAQMVTDSLNLEKVIAHHKEASKLYNKVLREVKPDERITDCTNCPILILANLSVANMDPKVKKLLNSSDLGSDELSSVLRSIEEDYEDRSSILELLEESIVNNLKDNMDYLQENYSWFAQFIANNDCNSDCQSYFFEGTDFRNRVAYIELLIIKAYNTEVISFNQSISKNYIKLTSLLEE